MADPRDEELARLRRRVADLEAENGRLVQQLAHLRTASMPPLWPSSSSARASGGAGAFLPAASAGASLLADPESKAGRAGGSRSATTSPVRALRPQSSPAVPVASSASLDGAAPPLMRSHSLGETLLGPAAAALSALGPAAAAAAVPEGHALCDVW